MTQDQNKKTLRHFQCRDYLWEVFEQMSAELECSTDYLINEAMRQYARSRNYGTSRNQPAPEPSPVAAPAPRAPIPQAPPMAPSAGPIPSLRGGAAQRPSIPAPPPPPRRDSVQMPSVARGPAGAPPPPRRPSSMPPPPPGRAAPPVMASQAPPPLPSAPGGRAAAITAGRPAAFPSLFVIFNGQKIPISKEEFVIGRGAKSADLAIKDGNISRRHAAIVFHNGAYFMKDLGSTNGVEFEGRRFDSKRIEEGDIFRMCDYELRFTYQ